MLAAVPAVSVVLTATPTAPDPVVGQLPPPAPAGPVLPLGTLAGQVGVGVAASDGQLVVRLAAPSRSDYYDPDAGRQRFTLSARLTGEASEGARDLRLRGCGQGCYVADAAWRDGNNVLTLQVAAEGWRGDVVSLVVPWPPQPAADQLTAAVAATRAAGKVAVYETVTSDTTGPLPEPTVLPMTGADYVAMQPYNTGVAPQVVQLPDDAAGQTRLALSFPAEARYLQVTLDKARRIVEEVQVDPKHLTRHHFVYQEDH